MPPNQDPSSSDTSVVQTADGRNLAFCQWGDLDGAPVFWLHGTPGSRLLRQPGDDYANHRLRVITYDRPGYGLSDRFPGRVAADTAVDIETIADALGLDRFSVAGVSSGAVHALAAAAALPTRATRCALVVALAPFGAEGLDFYAGMEDEDRSAFQRALEGPDALQQDYVEVKAWVDQGLPGLTLPEDTATMLVDAFQESFRDGAGGFIDDYLAHVRPLGFTVDAVRTPTRLLMAREDTSVPPAHGTWFASHLPDAQISWVDGGHIGARAPQEMQLLSWAGHGSATPPRADPQ